MIWLIWLWIAVAIAFEPKYKIKVNDLPIARSVATELSSVVKHNGSYEVLRINNHDMDLVCFLPDVDSIPDPTKKSVQRTEQELIDIIIKDFPTYFQAQFCSFTTGLNSGYWTYGYCFGDKIIQFHENLQTYKSTGQHVPELPDHVFVLGRFNGSDSKDPKIMNQSTKFSRQLDPQDFNIILDPFATGSNAASQKALSHSLSDGEICDLTNGPRTIEVIYRCDIDVDYDLVIVGVNEIKTCEYQVIINVRKLCQFDEFMQVSDEKIMDIVCNTVIEGNDSLGSNLKGMVEYNLPHELPPFPQPKSKKIDLQDYSIVAGGRGFYWARPKNFEYATDIYDRRTVVIYSGIETDTSKIIKTFSNMFSDSMEGKVLSPSSDSPLFKNVRVATWDDTFTAWYEVYDFKGEFIAVLKVFRNGLLTTKQISIQWLDPFTMIDQDGDAVPSSTLDPGRKYYEYQEFMRGEVDTYKELTNTVIVTKVVDVLPSDTPLDSTSNSNLDSLSHNVHDDASDNLAMDYQQANELLDKLKQLGFEVEVHFEGEDEE